LLNLKREYDTSFKFGVESGEVVHGRNRDFGYEIILVYICNAG
jgi:hypothetical protein